MLYTLLEATTTTGTGSGLGIWGTIIWLVVIFAIFWFMLIRPQKKQQKEQQQLMDSMAIGDYVLTTSGFYGVILDITEDDVIVEFGNNKNCRITMQKKAIAQVEKPASTEE